MIPALYSPRSQLAPERRIPDTAGAHRKEQTLSIHVLTGRAKRRPIPERVAPQPKSAALLSLVLNALDDAKAENVVAIDVADKTSLGDHIVIASGRSQRHVGAVADQIQKRLKEAGHERIRVEGMPQGDWVLVDAGDVMVHVFQPEIREFYNLEKMWMAERVPDAPLHA